MNNNLNIEKAVLSSIFFDYENIYTAKEQLLPKDFYFPVHQKVYEAMLKLHSEDMPIDEDFIRKRVGVNEVSDNVLIDILSANPITNIAAYCKEIKDKSIKRDLVSLATTIKKVAIEDDMSSAEATMIVEDELYKITDTSKNYKSRTISQIVESFKQKHKNASSEDGKNRFIKTGITQFDSKFNGFDKGNYVIIGARPSMGKTALISQIVLHNIKNGKGVVVDSLEMSAEDFMMRMIAQENQENISDLLNGLVKNFEQFHKTLNYFSNNTNLHIDDKVLSFNQLKSKFLKIKRTRDKKCLPTDLWVIDHIGYVKTNWKFKRHEELSIGSKMLKELAKELGITIIVLSQLNRAVTDRKGLSKNRPMLSDLKESGSLEEDADICIFPHRDSYYEKAERNEMEADVNKANILVLKNRNGRTGVINCDFKGSTNSFGNFPTMEIVYVENNNDYPVDVPSILM
ncbi:Replicative DNA helicase [Aliarcobacter thereius]|uniref:DnaB-like helicase C-terminal domain-containing protein n=1 Tax=Aliarcobacter thereius TaxID=544718 RepID=UPI0008289736|nr:DnaB-like helicase C-terminal domain-containing protein [Aliarcobacter thereius]OCL85303.1 Replicative DNA helicase [Aliarcobacter thereius]OCL85725.1 Replicative DNA helicase [Aliarcobacter thereius]